MEEMVFDQKAAKRPFSRIGWALAAILVVGSVLQALWFALPEAIWGADNWLTGSSWGVWLGTFLPLYLVAVPVGLWLLKNLPTQTPESKKLSVKHFFILLLVGYCLMYGGNLLGIGLSALLSGGQAENTVAEYAMDSNPLKVLVMVILAPLIEEYIFRKQIIDRTAKYGEKLAVFFSALTFGLFHGNLFQLFYAFGLGLVFAYIYIRTGRLRYSVLMHGIVNFMGAVVAPWVMSLVDMDTLVAIDPEMAPEALLEVYAGMMPGLLIYMLYALALMGMALAGLIQILIHYRHLVWKPAAAQLPKGTAVKTAYLNMGMIVLVLLCLLMTITALF